MQLYRQKEIKRSFILLEILVAISIICLLAGFLIYRPFRALRKELNLIISFEEDRVWEGKLMEIESELSTNCDKLPTEKKGEGQTKEFAIFLPGMQKKCTRTYRYWANHNLNDPEKSGHLIHLSIKKGKRWPDKPDYVFYSERVK